MLGILSVIYSITGTILISCVDSSELHQTMNNILFYFAYLNFIIWPSLFLFNELYDHFKITVVNPLYNSVPPMDKLFHLYFYYTYTYTGMQTGQNFAGVTWGPKKFYLPKPKSGHPKFE